ncbi:MAG: 2-amino-4-hydroxy-6-hydroxymethyldihydropteridine diphosphokinase [Actinomycetota bacterium]
MSRAVIALGANLDDPAHHLHGAAHRIDRTPGVRIVGRSHLFRTAPVGGPDQPDYINAVIIVETDRDPHTLLADLHSIEAEHGRIRDVHWGPRTLDLDLIAYDDFRSVDPELQVPHPRAHERAFVLVPWCDAESDAVFPGVGPVRDLVAGLDTAGCTVLEGPRVGES